jgi:hypothetical protein
VARKLSSGEDVPLIRRLALWVIFVFLVAIASSVVTFVIGFINGKSISVEGLLAEGEGAPITLAITADAVGRAAERQRLNTIPAIICSVILCFSILIFGITKTHMQDQRDGIDRAVAVAQRSSAEEGLKDLEAALQRHYYDAGRLMTTSAFLFLCGLGSSFWVIIGIEKN